MDKKYFTIVGCNHYYGSGFMEKMQVNLVKEPNNDFDKESRRRRRERDYIWA